MSLARALYGRRHYLRISLDPHAIIPPIILNRMSIHRYAALGALLIEKMHRLTRRHPQMPLITDANANALARSPCSFAWLAALRNVFGQRPCSVVSKRRGSPQQRI